MNGRLEKEIIFYDKTEKKLQGLPQIFNEYYFSMRANRISYTTIGGYIDNILHFSRFITNGELTEDFYKTITTTDIEKYMISLETKQTKDGIKRMGDDILQRRWSALNRFFDWLVKRDYIHNNPMIAVSRPKNQTEHKVVYLTKVEINRLFKAVENNSSSTLAIRDKALFTIAIATGLRASAIVNMNIDDIDFKNGIIKVIEKRQKIREIPIGENTINSIREWIEVRNQEFAGVDTNALFISLKNNRLSDDAANHALKTYCAEAGIQKKITMHKLRASCACLLAKNQVPVKAIAKQLGHNNITTSMRYIDVFNEDMEKAKNILDSAIG